MFSRYVFSTYTKYMRLLLTSSGLSKRQIGNALQEMAGKSPSECKVGFIPTAANVEPRAKDWLIGQFGQLQRYGFYNIDIVDISANGVDWRARLADCDILWLSGGNTFHLLDQVRKTGFDKWLKEHIDDKVYVGGSASSIVMTPTIQVASVEPGDENICGISDLTGLGYVPFEIEPHCDAARMNQIGEYAKTIDNSLYALDDLSAIKVIDDKVEIVSGGAWKLYEK